MTSYAPTTAPTLDAALNEVRETRLKSDLANLANALVDIEEEQLRLAALAQRIREVGANPRAFPEGTVHKLYKEAQGR